MEIDASPTSRKRRLTSSFANNSDGDGDTGNENIVNETPSKRLENHLGLPISRKTHHLNTRLILQSLALTRLYVTSNFSLYNPHSSPIVICVTREDDSLYRKLWSVPYRDLSQTTSNMPLPNLKYNAPLPLPNRFKPTSTLHHAGRTDLHRSLEYSTACRSDLYDGRPG